jgi:pimeloyl-ACP methyl ester carboxylesterase
MSFREEGTGITLLQVHGLGTGHHNYDLITPHLAGSLNVVDVDLPGYGDSDPLDGRPSIRAFADEVARFIEAKGYGSVHLHGTSLGGCVAMSLASRRPELVKTLVVSCSLARPDRAAAVMYDGWRAAATDGGERALADLTSQQGFSRAFWDRPESADTQQAFRTAIETATAPVFLRDLPAVQEVDLSAEAPRITVSTLLLGAEEDHMTPVKAAPSGLGMDALERLIPGSVLEVFPDCGHFISIERPRELADRILRFVVDHKADDEAPQ